MSTPDTTFAGIIDVNTDTSVPKTGHWQDKASSLGVLAYSEAAKDILRCKKDFWNYSAIDTVKLILLE
ncbi:unnamed protein product [Schistosoma curassoni]|uniref:DUF3800 domain-containing protein n=1 Tax=Schistosoma curassoni TaxID=6186 RepID=A0A183JKA7_9TREM|nr:unnamed protein product [Schistosoma curassoni]